MILKPIQELWQPCDGDTKDGICLPFVNPETIKIYAHGIVTAINAINCTTGASYPMALTDWDYVIANSTNNQPYTYLVNPDLAGGVGGCFYFEVTYGGVDYYTPCYQDVADTNCRLRDTIWIESEFSKYDCLNRWYGFPTPQSLIEGNNSLVFNNGMLVWGTKLNLPTEFEFTNFDTCIVTKSKALAGYEVEAFSLAPYFMELVEAIIGRGVIWLDEGKTKQYAVQSGTHFEKIRAFCRSQYDMKLTLTDCDCEIYHECDLNYDYVPELDCQASINYHCETFEGQCVNMADVTATVTHETGYMEFVFVGGGGSDVVRATEFETVLNICVLAPAGNFALQIITTTDTYYFYRPFMSNVVRVGNTVTFDYSDFFTPPVTFDCGLNFINNENWAIFTSQTIPNDTLICCYTAALLFELVVTGSPLSNAIWSANVPFVQIDLTNIAVPLPQGGNIEVDVDVFPELCGQISIGVIVNDAPVINVRFFNPDGYIQFNRAVNDTLTAVGGSLAIGTAIILESWEVLPLIGGDPYSGGSPTTGTGNVFTLTNVGLTDDILIRYTITDTYGNTAYQNLLFTQSGNAPDEDMILYCGVGALGGIVGTLANILPIGNISNSYVPVITMDELGIDFDNDNIYEQTTDANAPAILSHDYGGLGTFISQISVSTNAAGSYPALPFGIVRTTFVITFY